MSSSDDLEDIYQGMTIEAKSSHHIVKVMFPSNHLANYATFVDQFERVAFSGIQATEKFVKKITALFEEARIAKATYNEALEESKISKKTDVGEARKTYEDKIKNLRSKRNKEIMWFLSENTKIRCDFAISIGGRGRKEGTGMKIHSNSGIPVQQHKKGLLEKMHLRKQKEELTVKPMETPS